MNHIQTNAEPHTDERVLRRLRAIGPHVSAPLVVIGNLIGHRGTFGELSSTLDRLAAAGEVDVLREGDVVAVRVRGMGEVDDG